RSSRSRTPLSWVLLDRGIQPPAGVPLSSCAAAATAATAARLLVTEQVQDLGALGRCRSSDTGIEVQRAFCLRILAHYCSFMTGTRGSVAKPVSRRRAA